MSLQPLAEDLQHAGPAPAPLYSSGCYEAELKPYDYRELFMDIMNMSHANLEQIGRRVSCLKARDGSKLRRAFRTRTAELLIAASVAELESAARALAVLQKMDEVLPCDDFWSESDAFPKSSSADPTSWQCPFRALEERLGKISFQKRSQLDVLVRCHDVVSDLIRGGLMRSKARDPVMSCLMIWVQRAPLLEYRRRASLLRKITASEPTLLLALEQRLLQRTRESFPIGQFQGFVQLLLDLQAGGLPLLDGAGPHELDQVTGQRLPILQLALLSTLRTGFNRWPMRRLLAEIQGPVLKLGSTCEATLPELRAAAGARVCEGLRSVHSMILREVAPTRVQDELLDWSKLLNTLHGAGMLSLSESERLHIIGAPRDPGSLLYCCASVAPGSPELLSAYQSRAQELKVRHKDVSDMVVMVFALLGNGLEDHAMAPAPRPLRR